MAGLVAVVVVVLALAGASDAFFDQKQVTENDTKWLSLPSSFPAITIINFSAENKTNASLTVTSTFQGNESEPVTQNFTVDAGENAEQNIIIISKINSTRVLNNLLTLESETFSMTMTGLQVWSQARVTWRESHILLAYSAFLAFIQNPYAILLASLCILFAFSTCVTCVCMCRRCGKKHASEETASTRDEDNIPLSDSRALQQLNSDSRNSDDNKSTLHIRDNSLYGMIY